MKIATIKTLLFFIFLLITIISSTITQNFALYVARAQTNEIEEATPEFDLDTPVVVDESEFDQRLAAYRQKYEEYKKAHDVYVVARAQYLRSKTQKSKTDAKEATIKLLELRDDVVILYLVTLKSKLEETGGIGDARQQGLILKVDEEISWYQQHRNLISSAGSLEDLVSDSEEAKERQKTSERLYYEVLSNISYGKITNYSDRLSYNLELLRTKLEDIKSDTRQEYSFSTRKMQILDRWILEAENLNLRTEDKQLEADEVINKIIGERININKARQYNEIILKLSEGKQLLKEASSYLIEVIKEIKIAED